MIRVTQDVVISDRYLEVKMSRSGGAGGQHVNKTETKVDLRFDYQACEQLSARVKRRLSELGSSRLGKDGRLRFVCGRSRERTANLRECQDRLRELILRAMAPPPKKRRPTRPTRGSQRRRVDSKKKRGLTKKMRGKVRE